MHLSPRIGAIYITDHDVMIPITETGWRFQTFLGIEIECRIHEYGSQRGHILAYGMGSIEMGMLYAKDVLDMIHRNGGICVCAYPYQ